jgi:hypothetical protein
VGFNIINLCANLVPVLACNIQRGLLLQHTFFKIFIVRTTNAMDQKLFSYIAGFQSVSIVYQCGVSGNVFKMCYIATLMVSKSPALINSSLFHM